MDTPDSLGEGYLIPDAAALGEGLETAWPLGDGGGFGAINDNFSEDFGISDIRSGGLLPLDIVFGDSTFMTYLLFAEVDRECAR